MDSPRACTPIDKDLAALPKRPNLVDHAAACAAFTWDDARAALDGLPGGGLNIAFEAVDRHAAADPGRLAIRWLGKAGPDDEMPTRDLTYGDLRAQTSRFASALAGLGLRPGDRMFLLLGRVPELYVAALGALKGGFVTCPLFSAFGPEPIQQRMDIGDGRVLVTTPALYRRKVAGIRDRLPNLEHVILVGDGGAPVPAGKRPDGALDLSELLASGDPTTPCAPTSPDDMALLHFTSGTTGKPKGAVHVHGAVVHHLHSARIALDLQDGDVFWCTADPGWVTGTSYGIVAPLVCGLPMIVDEAEFDAGRWYRILREQRVTVWYTAPTAVRMLMKHGAPEAEGGRPFPDLRFVASVGEPLNPEGVVWGVEHLGMPIHDNWWQSETGGIMIANTAGQPVRPGSMGRPLPGVKAGIVRWTDDGHVVEVTDPDEEGELALRPGWPSMFRRYLHEPERTAKCFVDGWYLSGDLARRDADGFFWFVGRADDIIKTAGHMVGPFEVESALMEHPGVAEVGVIGKPDPIAGQIVKAFVALKPGTEPSEETRRELLGLARKRLGSAVAPKEISFLDGLPKTRSGKIMRRLLKARELGLPEGDTSTLERPDTNGEEGQ